MINVLNKVAFVFGGLFCITAIDGWFQAGCVATGIVLLGFVKLDYSQSVAHIALAQLVKMHTSLYVISREIRQNWRPFTENEEMAKEVILAEIRDLTPEHVREIMDKEFGK